MRIASLAALAGAALLLSACGGGGKPSGDPKTVVANAYEKTLTQRGLVSVDILLRSADKRRVTGYSENGSIGPNGAQLMIDRKGIGGTISHAILIRKGDSLVLYVDSSPTPLPKGKKWLAVDLTAYAKQRYGVPITSLVSADRSPLEPARLLGSYGTGLKDVGPDNLPVDILTERYSGKVNLYDAAKAQGVKGKGLKTVESDVGHFTQTIDVWVDQQGRLKQIVVSSPERSPGGENFTLRETVTFDYRQQGDPVVAPPAAEVQKYTGQ